jgi:hypothetical protein
VELKRLAAVALLLGCVGQAAPDASSEPAQPPIVSLPPMAAREVPFACDESAPRAPDGLRRLTMTQYRNSLRDLTRWALGAAQPADAVLALVGLERVPVDRREPTALDPRGGYRRLDQALDQRTRASRISSAGSARARCAGRSTRAIRASTAWSTAAIRRPTRPRTPT